MPVAARASLGRKAFNCYTLIIQGLCVAFAWTLAAIIILIGVDVAGRYLGLGNLPWLTEFFEYVLYAGTFLAAPWALRLGAHIRIDLILGGLNARAALAMELIADAFGLLLSIVLTFYGVRAVVEAHENNMIQYKTWSTPESLLLSAVAISGFLLAVEFLLRLLRVKEVLVSKAAGTSREGL